MKNLYILSVERFSGKTALCLAIGKQLIRAGHKVGYLKPLSLQPWRIGDHIADQDAAFVKDALHLDEEPWELCPLVVTPETLRQHLAGNSMSLPLQQIKDAISKAGEGKDVMLLEGGGTMREGYSMDLPTPRTARELDTKVIGIVRYRDDVQVLDDSLAVKSRIGEKFCGLFINRAPETAMEFINKQAIPFLASRGVDVYGVLPELRELAAITVKEIVSALQAEVLTENASLKRVVENLTVGAMTAEAALSRFRRQRNKAVFTGGDRTDIQLAALETSTSCLILTGNLRPSPLIIKQAEDFGVPILLTRQNTMEAIEGVEKIFGKTNLGQEAKLQQFEALLENYGDLPRLLRCLGL